MAIPDGHNGIYLDIYYIYVCVCVCVCVRVCARPVACACRPFHVIGIITYCLKKNNYHVYVFKDSYYKSCFTRTLHFSAFLVLYLWTYFISLRWLIGSWRTIGTGRQIVPIPRISRLVILHAESHQALSLYLVCPSLRGFNHTKSCYYHPCPDSPSHDPRQMGNSQGREYRISVIVCVMMFVLRFESSDFFSIGLFFLNSSPMPSILLLLPNWMAMYMFASV